MEFFYLHGIRVDCDRRLMSHDNKELSITPKALAVLNVLHTHQGNVVSRDELLNTCWPGRFGADDSLFKVVSELRRKISELLPNTEVIQTVSKSGYRLVQDSQSNQTPKVDELQQKLPLIKRDSVGISKIQVLALFSLLLVGTIVGALIQKHINSTSKVDAIAVSKIQNFTNKESITQALLGLQEELAHQLTRSGQTKVAANISTRHVTGKDFSVQEMSKQLNVSHIVQGSIHDHGSGFRFVMHLVDGKTGYQVWSQSYDALENDWLNAQQMIVNDIAKQIAPGIKLNESKKYVLTDHVNHSDYRHYLSVMPHLYGTEPSKMAAAQVLLEDLLVNSPNFERAQIALSLTISIRSVWAQLSEVTAYNASEKLLAPLKARRSHDPLYHLALAMQEMPRTVSKELGDWQVAKQHFESALELEPNNDLVLKWYIHGAYIAGDQDVAMRLIERALETDPLNEEFYVHKARFTYSQMKYEDSITYSKKALAINSESAAAHYLSALVLYELGKHKQAEQHIGHCLASAIGYMNCWEHRFNVYDAAGFEEYVMSVFDVAGTLAPAMKRYIPFLKSAYSGEWEVALGLLQSMQPEEMSAPFLCGFALATLYQNQLSEDHHSRKRFETPAKDACNWVNKQYYTILFAELDGEIDFAEKVLSESLAYYSSKQHLSSSAQYSLAGFKALAGDKHSSLTLLNSVLLNGGQRSLLYRGSAIARSPVFHKISSSEEFQRFLDEMRLKNQKILESSSTFTDDFARFESFGLLGN